MTSNCQMKLKNNDETRLNHSFKTPFDIVKWNVTLYEKIKRNTNEIMYVICVFYFDDGFSYPPAGTLWHNSVCDFSPTEQLVSYSIIGVWMDIVVVSNIMW